MDTGKKITSLIGELEEKFTAEGHNDRGLLLGSEAVSGLMIVAADIDALGQRLERVERRLDRLETSGGEQSFDFAAELADLRRKVAKMAKGLHTKKATKKK
jgi:ubiquinone biosynthesis protein UbiJ